VSRWLLVRAADVGLAMRVAALALLALALALPGISRERPIPRALVVVDVTQSMNATDVMLDGQAARRLAFAKRAVREAIQTLPCGAEVGLAAFTEYRSYLLLLPLEVCAYRHELMATLDNLDGRLAWAGASEVAKGLHSALRAARGIQPQPSVVFITDGHEAPPIHPNHRPRFDGTPGEVAGLLVGVGGDAPVPIPKFDLEGRSLGTWTADEVLQTDPFSAGRSGSVKGEQLVETEDAAIPSWYRVGNEHLTSLREAYLRALADELKLGYVRLESPGALATAMAQHADRPGRVVFDIAPPLLILALVLFVLAEVAPRIAERVAGGRITPTARRT